MPDDIQYDDLSAYDTANKAGEPTTPYVAPQLYSNGSLNTDVLQNSTFQPTAAQSGTNWQDALKGITNFIQQNKGVLSAGALASALSGGSSGGGGAAPVGIPSLVANRMQVPGTNDPYRVPGSSGRQYFTDTIYSDPSQQATAQAMIQAQAQAIAANQPNAPVPSFAMPWNKQPGGQVYNYPPTMTQQGTNTPIDLAGLIQQYQNAGLNNDQIASNLANKGYTPSQVIGVTGPQYTNAVNTAFSNVGKTTGTNTNPVTNTTTGGKTTGTTTGTTTNNATTTTTPTDPLLAAYMAGDYAKAQQLINAQHLNPQDIVTKYGLGQTDAKTVAKNLGYTGDISGLNYGAASAPGTWDYLANNVIGHLPSTSGAGIAALPSAISSADQVASAPVTPTTAPVYYGQGVSGGDIVNFVNQNMDNPAAIASAMQQYGLSANDVAAATGYTPQQVSDYIAPASGVNDASVNAATGGMMGYAAGGQPKEPRYLSGGTDGMADEINTTIDDRERAKLSHGEFVIPADVVSHLGNGNSDAGAKKLYQMMDRVREARTGNPKQGKRINPDKFTGGIAGYAKGGDVKAFAGETGSTVSSGSTSGIAGLTNTGAQSSQTLSSWAAPYVTSMLGQGQALANAPMQTYQGPLTAGQSALQNQQFAGLSQMAQTGYDPMNYQSQDFNQEQAQKYMNPYLSASLAPQLSELQRQAQIGNTTDASRLTNQGAFGGGRQAVLMGEQNRNLLDKSNALIGAGYNTAYTNAMAQFNADQARQAAAQQNTEASRQFSANTGLKTLDLLGQAGATQRDIAQQGISADQAQFKEQQLYPYQQLAFQQSLLGGLPISTAVTTPNAMSDTGAILAALGVTSNPDIAAKLKTLGLA